MTEEEYEKVLAEIWGLFDALPDSEEEKRLIELSEKIGVYEDVYYPM